MARRNRYKWVCQDADGKVWSSKAEPTPNFELKGWELGLHRQEAQGNPNPHWSAKRVDTTKEDWDIIDGWLVSAPKVVEVELIRPPIEPVQDDGWETFSAGEMDVIAAHPLYPIYLEAIAQAAFGKGERHGGNTTPFLEQPWVQLAQQHGGGFLSGQSAKKLGEAQSKVGKAFRTEMLGALNYGAMRVLFEDEFGESENG